MKVPFKERREGRGLNMERCLQEQIRESRKLKVEWSKPNKLCCFFAALSKVLLIRPLEGFTNRMLPLQRSSVSAWECSSLRIYMTLFLKAHISSYSGFFLFCPRVFQALSLKNPIRPERCSNEGIHWLGFSQISLKCSRRTKPFINQRLVRLFSQFSCINIFISTLLSQDVK